MSEGAYEVVYCPWVRGDTKVHEVQIVGPDATEEIVWFHCPSEEKARTMQTKLIELINDLTEHKAVAS